MIKSSKTIKKSAPAEDLKSKKDDDFDISLRPTSLEDFIGQESIKENLKIGLEACKKRKDAIDHFLLYGTPGIGKTSLAYIIARELGVSIKTTSGPAITKTGDLAALLTNLKDRDVLFIDEIHRLNLAVEEVLYPAMEDYKLDIILGKGPSAKSLRLDLARFTLIGATTKIGAISAPMRTRFGHIYRLNYYSEENISKIVTRSAKILGIALDPDSSLEIAKRARKTPRIANRLLKRVRDFALVKNKGEINEKCTKEALDLLEIDHLGLDEVDRRLLETLIEKFSGGPTGLQTLAHATSEEKETVEEVYEPFLIQLGFIDRTPKGRVATKRAYEHLAMKPKKL